MADDPNTIERSVDPMTNAPIGDGQQAAMQSRTVKVLLGLILTFGLNKLFKLGISVSDINDITEFLIVSIGGGLGIYYRIKATKAVVGVFQKSDTESQQ